MDFSSRSTRLRPVSPRFNTFDPSDRLKKSHFFNLRLYVDAYSIYPICLLEGIAFREIFQPSPPCYAVIQRVTFLRVITKADKTKHRGRGKTDTYALGSSLKRGYNQVGWRVPSVPVSPPAGTRPWPFLHYPPTRNARDTKATTRRSATLRARTSVLVDRLVVLFSFMKIQRTTRIASHRWDFQQKRLLSRSRIKTKVAERLQRLKFDDRRVVNETQTRKNKQGRQDAKDVFTLSLRREKKYLANAFDVPITRGEGKRGSQPRP